MTSDRRQSHRFSAPEDRSQATLKVGDDSHPARLVDRSATGLSVLVASHPGVYEGEAVWLQAEGVWVKAHVARVTLESGGVRVGLTRVAEPSETPLLQTPFRLWRMPKNHRVPVIIALALLMALPGVLWLEGRFRPTAAIATDDDPLELNPAAQHDALETIQKLGPAVFARGEVVRRLGLTRAQLDHVRSITLRAQQAVELARDTGASADEIRHLWRAAQEQARTVLNRSQQARWDEILRQLERDDL